MNGGRDWFYQPPAGTKAQDIFGLRVDAVLFGNSYSRALNSAGPVVTTVPTIMTEAGGAWRNTSTASTGAYARLNRNFVFGTDFEATLVAVVKKRTVGADTNAICGWGSFTGAGSTTLFRLTGGTTPNTSVRFQAQDAAGNVGYNTDSNATTPLKTDFFHNIVVTFDLRVGGTLQYYIDGKPNGTVNQAGVALNATIFNVLNVGSLRSNAFLAAAGFDVALVAYIAGKVNVQQGMLLSSNPWMIFQDKPRPWRLAAAAPGPGGANNPGWGRLIAGERRKLVRI